jgi:hypothetical protein
MNEVMLGIDVVPFVSARVYCVVLVLQGSAVGHMQVG